MAAPPLLGLAAPLTGATLGWIVLGQSLSPVQLAGMAITLSAIAYGATYGSRSPVEAIPLRRPQPVCAAA
jgi:probable blue pigment (indigoidine) exporter